MTDRFNGLLVTLENDIREDDAEAIILAIRQLCGVIGCKGNVVDIQEHLAETRIRHELWGKMQDIFFPD